MRREHRGVTVVEVVLWAALASLVLGAATGLWAATGRGARMTMDHDSAQVAACQAIEAIRREAERMFFIDPARDLAVFDGGRGVSFRYVRAGGDPWRPETDLVTFRAVPAGRGGLALLCTKGGRTRRIRTAPLADLRIRYLARPGARSRLSVLAVGMPSEKSRVRATATATISLPSFDPHHHYILSLKEN